MTTQEIPRDEWTTFFDTLGKMPTPKIPAEVVLLEGATHAFDEQEARDLPLEGITATSTGAAPETIAISIGETPEDHVTHTITGPTRVWLEQTSEGANAALEIESADEVKTLLRFRAA